MIFVKIQSCLILASEDEAKYSGQGVLIESQEILCG